MKQLGISIASMTLLMMSAVVPAVARECQRIVPVSSDVQLADALSGAQGGDCILLEDGAYSGFTVTASGTEDSPIVIRAIHLGGATISSGVIHLSQTSYVTLAGLKITTAGGSQTIDGETIAAAVWFEATQHSRLSRSWLDLGGQSKNTQWVLLSGNSNWNRIDHNDFGPDTVGGSHYVWPRGKRAIDGVTPPSDRTDWANGNGPVNPNMARHTLIDYNNFHDKASGSAETIVLGGLGVTGDYQDTFTTIENNLFVNCDGDAEIVSVKASSNIIRYNTVVTSGGVLSARSGNKNSFYGNFILAGGKSGSAGVKLNEKDHVVYNNYIENVDQYPIMLENGDPYSSPSFQHAQVVNAHIAYNTVVNPSREVLIGHTSTRILKPDGMIFANNLITGSGTIFRDAGSTNSTYAQNIIYPFDPGITGFTVVDPKLTTVNGLQKLSLESPAIGFADPAYFPFVRVDMDGQPRGRRPDTGADEFSFLPIFRKPLTSADVGPDAFRPPFFPEPWR